MGPPRASKALRMLPSPLATAPAPVLRAAPSSCPSSPQEATRQLLRFPRVAREPPSALAPLAPWGQIPILSSAFCATAVAARGGTALIRCPARTPIQAMRGSLAGGSSSSRNSSLTRSIPPGLSPLSSSYAPSAASPSFSAESRYTLAAQSASLLRRILLQKGSLGPQLQGKASRPPKESYGIASHIPPSHSHSHSPLCTMRTPLGIALNSCAAFTGTRSHEALHGKDQGDGSGAHHTRVRPDSGSGPSPSEEGHSSPSLAACDVTARDPSSSGAVCADTEGVLAAARQSLAPSPVIVISGPTASGKTRLAIRLALLLGGEIVSADSIQVYRGLDIGSAKSPLPERMGVPHHVIDILDPAQEYTAGDFFCDARAAVREVQSRGKVPVVVGGTGLYLRWFLYGKPDTPRSDPAQVEAVEREIQEAIARAKAQAQAQAISRATKGSEACGQPRVEAAGQPAHSATEWGPTQATADCSTGGKVQSSQQAHAQSRTRDTPPSTGIVMAEEEGDREVSIDEWAAAVGALAIAGDPRTAGQLARNDWYRLKRAFTILRASGQPRSMHPLPSEAALGSPDRANSGQASSPPRTQELHKYSGSEGAGQEEQAGELRTGKGALGEWEQEEERGHGGAVEDPPLSLDFDFRCFFLAAPRGELYRRIDRRCEEMVAEGLLEEALMLRQMGLHADSSPATRGIGYRQALHFLDAYEEALGRTSTGVLPLADAKALFLSFLTEMQQASRNLAKRQTTWFRKERLYTWLDATLPLEELVKCVLEGCQPNDASGRGTEAASSGTAESLRRQSETEGKKMKGYASELQVFNDDNAIERQVRWLEGQLHADVGRKTKTEV